MKKGYRKHKDFICYKCGKFTYSKYWCAKCKSEYNKKWRETNRDEKLEKRRAKDKIRYKKMTKEQGEKRRAVTRNFYMKHKSRILSRNLDYLKKARELVLEHYGYKCQCCGEKHNEFLTIDHINGGAIKHRKQIGRNGRHFYVWIIKNNYPKDLQLLCCNCNFAKGIYGECPHKKEERV